MEKKKHSMRSEFLKKCLIFTIVIFIHLLIFKIIQQIIFNLIGLYVASVLLSIFFTLSFSIVIKNMFNSIPKN